MSAAGQFLIYCIEMYRREKALTGREAYDLFAATGADEYITKSSGALHTTGEGYILADIEGYIEGHKKSLSSPPSSRIQ